MSKLLDGHCKQKPDSDEKEARHWTKNGNDRIQCHLCPHNCMILEGQSGVCRVRTNHGQRLIATSYGKITSLALDPIEKKPLAGFKPGSHILSIGSYGCNFRCAFCQNWILSQQDPPWQMIYPPEMIQKAKDAIPFGNIGLAYTYNEPLIHFEYVYDCARLAHASNLYNVIVTNGSINIDPLEELLPWVDAMNIDLKSWRPVFYKTVCGGQIEPVKTTIKRAAQSCHVELTTLLIPGLNDSEEDMDEMAAWIAGIDPDIILHLTRHHPEYLMQEPKPISIDRIRKLADIARCHLSTVMSGNVF
jgi:pyruvate formate lyase activating enzyme